MITFIKKNKQIFLFLLFGLLSGMYFILQQLPLSHHIIHIPLDDKIPFLEVFIIPYVLWYAYVALPMALTCFSKPKSDFIGMCVLLFSGVFISLAVFAIYPTAIDFRPASLEGDNILIRLTQYIYSSDLPTNVCPSLHCYEAAAIHISFCKSRLMKNRPVLKLLSLIMVILICLSTMFIKQHSAVDVFFGLLLVVPTYFLTYRIIMPALFKTKNLKQISAPQIKE